MVPIRRESARPTDSGRQRQRSHQERPLGDERIRKGLKIELIRPLMPTAWICRTQLAGSCGKPCWYSPSWPFRFFAGCCSTHSSKSAWRNQALHLRLSGEEKHIIDHNSPCPPNQLQKFVGFFRCSPQPSWYNHTPFSNEKEIFFPSFRDPARPPEGMNRRPRVCWVPKPHVSRLQVRCTRKPKVFFFVLPGPPKACCFCVVFAKANKCRWILSEVSK